MLKIRLSRIGTKKRPFYRVVAVDERAKRTGEYIELLGTYNPLTEPKEVKLKQDRIDYWIKQGAQPSEGYLRMIGKAPQRPPRKPKREKKAKEPKVESKVEEAKAEETPAEPEPKVKEAPVETLTEQPQAGEKPAEVAKVEEATPVIPNVSEESPDLKSTDSSASPASGVASPQNDDVEKSGNKKDERPA